jgi:hypothetical protein
MTKPLTQVGSEVREMNDDEFAQWQKDQEENKLRKAELEAKAKARADLLSKLGIDEEEAKLLLS